METVKYSKADIKIIADRLSKGDIVAFPTDTVFGLACVMDKEAIKKVYEAKGRDFNKPLPVMCNGLEMIKEIAYVDDISLKIINKFMPGALTIVFKKKDNVDSYITQGLDTIGIRVPNDEWILSLIENIGKPIMVTSANISNSGSLLSYLDVYDSMKNRIDGIVCEDARGQCSSTIIDVTGKLQILRQGPITLTDIEEAL